MKQIFKVVREYEPKKGGIERNAGSIFNQLSNACPESTKYSVTEEPEQPIDFDALYKDLLKDCGDSCTKDESCKACVFDFLKSKKLTAPKPFEIPVNKIWKLKEKYVNYFESKGIDSTQFDNYTEEPECVELYDLHEEPDYSKITNGSIVVVSSKDDKIKSAEIVDHFDSNYIYCNGCVSYELKYVKIRIVELAKE